MRYTLGKLKPRLNNGMLRMNATKSKPSKDMHSKVSNSETTYRELSELFLCSDTQVISFYLTAAGINPVRKDKQTFVFDKNQAVAALNSYAINGKIVRHTSKEFYGHNIKKALLFLQILDSTEQYKEFLSMLNSVLNDAGSVATESASSNKAD